MRTKTRKHWHMAAAVFFAVQIPPAIWLAVVYPGTFNAWWKIYLIFLSIYAIVVGHLSAVSAETPTDK